MLVLNPQWSAFDKHSIISKSFFKGEGKNPDDTERNDSSKGGYAKATRNSDCLER